MYILKAKNINKYFQDRLVLKSISLKLSYKNNIVGLIGPNGSGKTTLLKCLAGYINCKYDSINLYPDIDLFKTKDNYQELVSFVPDTDNISPYLTGREFLNLVIDMRKIPKDIAKLKVNFLADYYDIKESLDQLMKEYSHGMIKKIALIAGFLPQVKLFLLDEPFNGLDPEMITLTKNLILAYTKNDVAFIISSHYLQGVEEICKSIVILDKGQINYEGSVGEFITRYKSNNLETSWIQYLGISDKKNELIQKIIDCN